MYTLRFIDTLYVHVIHSGMPLYAEYMYNEDITRHLEGPSSSMSETQPVFLLAV